MVLIKKSIFLRIYSSYKIQQANISIKRAARLFFRKTKLGVVFAQTQAQLIFLFSEALVCRQQEKWLRMPKRYAIVT